MNKNNHKHAQEYASNQWAEVKLDCIMRKKAYTLIQNYEYLQAILDFCMTAQHKGNCGERPLSAAILGTVII